MHHLLAGSRVRLTYLQDWRARAGIDWPTIFDDLTDAGAAINRWQWCDLDGLTHVVLANDRSDERYAGVLGLTARISRHEPWLTIGVASVRPDESAAALSRAMLAHALARIVCLDGKPAGIAAAARDQPTLASLCQRLRSAALYPPAEGNVISLPAASLARRIGGSGDTVLDLRAAAETTLLRDLRGLHGGRSVRTPPAASVMAKAARSVGATRRPRKATRTGRTG